MNITKAELAYIYEIFAYGKIKRETINGWVKSVSNPHRSCVAWSAIKKMIQFGGLKWKGKRRDKNNREWDIYEINYNKINEYFEKDEPEEHTIEKNMREDLKTPKWDLIPDVSKQEIKTMKGCSKTDTSS